MPSRLLTQNMFFFDPSGKYSQRYEPIEALWILWEKSSTLSDSRVNQSIFVRSQMFYVFKWQEKGNWESFKRVIKWIFMWWKRRELHLLSDSTWIQSPSKFTPQLKVVELPVINWKHGIKQWLRITTGLCGEILRMRKVKNNSCSINLKFLYHCHKHLKWIFNVVDIRGATPSQQKSKYKRFLSVKTDTERDVTISSSKDRYQSCIELFTVSYLPEEHDSRSS